MVESIIHRMKTSALQDEDKYILRMPEGMRKQFTELAKQNDRSLNSELIHRLKISLLVPDSVARACEDVGGAKDPVEFAAHVFRKAGLKVTITLPEKED